MRWSSPPDAGRDNKLPERTEATLLAHCGENLTRCQVPHEIVFPDERPKSQVGKILRPELRDRA